MSYAPGLRCLRCGTAVAANYRASCRARPGAEFAALIGVVVEEADESGFWLEMLAEAEIVRRALLKNLLQESTELPVISRQHDGRFVNDVQTVKLQIRHHQSQIHEVF
jgi:four helix bundle protein